MDEITGAVLSIQPTTTDQARRWFTLVCETYGECVSSGETSWDGFRERLIEAAAGAGFSAEIPEVFAEYLDETPAPLSVVAAMSDQGEARLSERYAEAAASAGTADGYGQPAAADGSWEAAAAEGYGQTAMAEAPPAEDLAAWNSYLATNGPFWNGTEEAWPQFREWFLYYAAEARVSQSAEGFIAYLDAQRDKIAAFAAYGVRIAGPAPAAGEPVPPAEEPAAYGPSADAGGAGAESADSGTTVEEVVAEIGDSVIAEFRSDYPQFGDMSDDEVRQLLTGVLNESVK